MENPRQSGSRDFESVLRPALADLQLSERRELLRKSCAFISSNAATFRLPARNYLIKLLEFPSFLPSFLRISSCLIRLFSSNGIEKGIKKIQEYQITSNYIFILFVDRARRRERERFFSIVEERYKWQHRAYSCEVEFRKCYVRRKIHVYRTPISWSTCQTVYAYIYPSSAKYEARTASQCLDTGRELEESFVLKEILDIIRYFKLTAIYNKLSNFLIKSFYP